MNEKEVYSVLRESLYEFPVTEVKVNMPEWIACLNPSNSLKCEYIEKIKERGSDLESVEKQISYFKEGFPFLKLESSAVVDNGILRLDEQEVQALVENFDSMSSESDLTLLKFVPASGAATRMFKSLFSLLEEDKSDKSVSLSKHFIPPPCPPGH